MSGDRSCRATAVLNNKNGLHARPAHLLVQTANAYASRLLLGREGEAKSDGKSIMSIMMLAAEAGTVLELESVGPDCEEQMRAVLELFAAKFGEE